ncbi:glycolate oxidase subunit GlcE [Methylogaea oryzae]|nr:glycolate oxidase subunit GlcE [Methylogaea oryzae]
MSKQQDISAELQAAVEQAYRHHRPLAILGSGSKAFLGRPLAGEALPVAGHRGILHYEPSELVLTARAGTPLAEIEAALAQHGQMLAFEPPHHGPGATLGGTVACGLSGPRRPYSGSVRDFVLGVKILNGKGEILRFGGEVMKNVAGYDVSRLMAGAHGTLGVLLEISLKVLPQPEAETTLRLSMSATEAIAAMNRHAAGPLPFSAMACDHGVLHLRLSGAAEAVAAACRQLEGETMDNGFWENLREQRLNFFQSPGDLWRLSLAPATPPLDLPGLWLYDWGGAQRWLKTDAPHATVFAAAAAAGGHATLFRPQAPADQVFQPLPESLMALHRRLQLAFDPVGVLNPGRIYP